MGQARNRLELPGDTTLQADCTLYLVSLELLSFATAYGKRRKLQELAYA